MYKYITREIRNIYNNTSRTRHNDVYTYTYMYMYVRMGYCKRMLIIFTSCNSVTLNHRQATQASLPLFRVIIAFLLSVHNHPIRPIVILVFIRAHVEKQEGEKTRKYITTTRLSMFLTSISLFYKFTVHHEREGQKKKNGRGDKNCLWIFKLEDYYNLYKDVLFIYQ